MSKLSDQTQPLHPDIEKVLNDAGLSQAQVNFWNSKLSMASPHNRAFFCAFFEAKDNQLLLSGITPLFEAESAALEALDSQAQDEAIKNQQAFLEDLLKKDSI